MKRLLARRERAIEHGRRAIFAQTVGGRDRDGQLAWFGVLTGSPSPTSSTTCRASG